jgi:hypothetical protein
MTIHSNHLLAYKYAVITSPTDQLPDCLNTSHGNPVICSFYGIGNYTTVKKDAIDLAKTLHKTHPNRNYVVVELKTVFSLIGN